MKPGVRREEFSFFSCPAPSPEPIRELIFTQHFLLETKKNSYLAGTVAFETDGAAKLEKNGSFKMPCSLIFSEQAEHKVGLETAYARGGFRENLELS